MARVRNMLCLLVALAAAAPSFAAPAHQAAGYDVRIVDADSRAYPERVRLTVQVADASGATTDDLDVSRFAVTEEGAAVGELVIEQRPEVAQVVLVADLSDTLPLPVFETIAAAFRQLIGDLFVAFQAEDGAPAALELRLVTPSDGTQPPFVSAPNRTQGAASLALSEGTDPLRRPDGATRLAEALDAAVALGPEHVIVLSDGQDLSAPDSAYTDLAVRAASRTSVHAFELRASAVPEDTRLRRLAEATSGSYSTTIDGTLAALVTRVRAEAPPGSYRLAYRAPPRDTPLAKGSSVAVRVVVTPSGQSPVAVEQVLVVAEPPWDAAAPAPFTLAVQGYPAVRARIRLQSDARRALDPPPLESELQVLVDGTPARNLRLAPLADDLPPPESIAVLLDTRREQLEQRLELAALLMDVKAAAPPNGDVSRMAFFRPTSLDSPAWEQFRTDYGALRNVSINEADDAFRSSSVDPILPALQHALEAASKDSQLYDGPAHVILFSDAPATEYADAIAEARRLRVALHVVTTRPPADAAWVADVAAATGGALWSQPGSAELSTLSRAIAATRPAAYELTFDAPWRAAAQSYQLEVSLRGVVSAAQPSAQIAGGVTARPPLSSLVQLALALALFTILLFLTRTRPALEQLPASESSHQPSDPIYTSGLNREFSRDDSTPQGILQHQSSPLQTTSSTALAGEAERRQQALAVLGQRGERLIAEARDRAAGPPPPPRALLEDDDDRWSGTRRAAGSEGATE